MRKAFIVKNAIEINPLGRRPGDLILGNTRLSDYRRSALRAAGCSDVQVVELNEKISGPALLIAEDTFVSTRALKVFCRIVKTQKPQGPLAMVLPRSRQTELFHPLQDVAESSEGFEYAIRFIPKGHTGTAQDLLLQTPCDTATLPYREILMTQKIPRFILGTPTDEMEVPLTSTVVMRIRHWVHVLRLAHLWPQIQLIEHSQRRWWKTVWNLVLGFSFSRRQRIANYYDRFCFIHRSVHIHPTATIEASIIGKNVRIGAYANVVGSVIGDNVTIEDRANINHCVLGAETFVSKNSTVVASVAFGPTDVCVNGIQYAMIDEGCALTSWARPLDALPNAPVRVKDGDALREVGLLPCGVAFGKNCYVGANVMIAPGRVIPAETTLLAEKDGIVT